MMTLKFLKSLTIIFIFTSFVALSSCSARTPWVRVQTSDPRFDYVGYEDSTHTIWLEIPYDNAVYRLERPNDDLSFGRAEKIATPNNSDVTGLCASSDGVWISGFVPHDLSQSIFKNVNAPSSPLTIYKYTSKAKSWQAVSVHTKSVSCKSLKDGGVVFWGLDKLIRFNSTDEQSQNIEKDTDWAIVDVADDPEGNLWISTANGEIYKQEQSDWILVDALGSGTHPKLFVDNSGNLWVASNDKYIYKYSTTNLTPFRERLLESSLGLGQDFFQENSGTIWVVASNKLLVQKEGQFQEVNLPQYSDLLRFGFFDRKTNTLFVSTDKGVFALDLDTLSK